MGDRLEYPFQQYKPVLSIDTSCDETAAAVTRGVSVISNVIWSQASEHANFGGVMPILAKRRHEERINWVVDRALARSGYQMDEIEAIVVVSGPGLAIALGVGIAKARELAEMYQKRLYEINHIEGHLFSGLARPAKSGLSANTGNNESNVSFPAYGLVVSGGHTELLVVEKPGKYIVLAKTQDDALGEALDKAARMMGLGYPGGAVLEKMARLGDAKQYLLPLPMARQREFDSFSYSGLKSAAYRLIDGLDRPLNKKQIYDLSASFQNRAFQHLEKIIETQIGNYQKHNTVRHLLAGGGVMANIELRKRLRQLTNRHDLKLMLPYSNRLVGDNAAMAGVAFSIVETEVAPVKPADVDRKPRWRIEER